MEWKNKKEIKFFILLLQPLWETKFLADKVSHFMRLLIEYRKHLEDYFYRLVSHAPDYFDNLLKNWLFDLQVVDNGWWFNLNAMTDIFSWMFNIKNKE